MRAAAAAGLAKVYALPLTATAYLLWTVVSMVLGASRIPTFQSGRSLPLWSFYPAVSAAILTVSASNGAAWLERQCAWRAGVRDRLVVAAVLLVMIGGGTSVVGSVIGIPRLWVVSVVLMGLVLGAATVHLTLSFVLAFTAGMIPMVLWSAFTVSQPLEQLGRWFGAAGVLLWAVAAAAAAGVYCERGAHVAPPADV